MNSRNVQTSSKDMPLRAKDHNKQSLRPLAFPLSLPFHLPTAPACNETIGTSHCGPYMSLHYTSPSNCCTAMANRPFERAWSRSCSTIFLNIVVVTGTVVCLKPQTLGSFGLILDGLIGVSTTSGPLATWRLWPHAAPHPGDSPQGAPVVRCSLIFTIRLMGLNRESVGLMSRNQDWRIHLPKKICKNPIQTNDPKSIAPILPMSPADSPHKPQLQDACGPPSGYLLHSVKYRGSGSSNNRKMPLQLEL